MLGIALAAQVTRALPVPAVLAAAEAEPARLNSGIAVEGGPASSSAPVHRGVVALHLMDQVPDAGRGRLFTRCPDKVFPTFDPKKLLAERKSATF